MSSDAEAQNSSGTTASGVSSAASGPTRSSSVAGVPMPVMFDTYLEMQSFVDLTAEDSVRLKAVAPIFDKHVASITDAFYETLQRYPTTSALVEGRIEGLKKTHMIWMRELFDGDYGEGYFNRRLRIGAVHAKLGIEPRWVEGVMHVVRAHSLMHLRAEIQDVEVLNASYQSLLKILDLDLLIINLAYNEEMFDRLTAATGMRRPLLINLIRRAAKM